MTGVAFSKKVSIRAALLRQPNSLPVRPRKFSYEGVFILIKASHMHPSHFYTALLDVRPNAHLLMNLY